MYIGDDKSFTSTCDGIDFYRHMLRYWCAVLLHCRFSSLISLLRRRCQLKIRQQKAQAKVLRTHQKERKYCVKS